jgi:hypothetical protein
LFIDLFVGVFYVAAAAAEPGRAGGELLEHGGATEGMWTTYIMERIGYYMLSFSHQT